MQHVVYSKDRLIKIEVIYRRRLSGGLLVRASMLSEYTGMYHTQIDCDNNKLSLAIAVLFVVKLIKRQPLFREAAIPFPK